MAYNLSPMYQPSAFSTLFKFLRKKHRLAQKQVAGMLNCELQSVSNWETGLFLPDADRLPIIKKKLRLQNDEFRDLLAAYRNARMRIEDQKLSYFERVVKDREHTFPAVIPLFRVGDTVNPVAVFEATEWRGLYVKKPLQTGNRLVGAFMLEDDSMSPKFKRNEILFFSTTQSKPIKNNPYIVCIKDRTCCRLLTRQVGFKYVFRGAGKNVEPINVKMKDINWLYQVIFNKRLDEIK